MTDEAVRNDSKGIVNSIVDWRVGLGVVLALSILFAAQTWVDDPSTTSFGILFARQLIQWLLWLALVPVVFDIGRLMRRRGALRTSSIVLLVSASLVVATFHAVLVAVVHEFLAPGPSANLRTAIGISLSSHLGANLVRFSAISAIYHAIAYHHEVRDREMNAARHASNLAQARLETLEGRLQPQFLFSALDALTTLIRTDASAAEELVGHLSELLRVALDASSAREATLERELAVLEHYVAIQRTLFKERLEVVVESEPDALTAYMPHCILLPLVENAIRHGIASRETPGKVWIRSSRHGDVLHLHVQDDGVGIGRAPAETNGRGIGIGSTRARLNQLYGGSASFTIGQVLPTGTLVTIELPFRTDAKTGELTLS